MLWNDSPFFVFCKAKEGRIHSKSRILRLVPRRSTFLPHKGWQYDQPPKTIPRPLGIVGARIERGHLLLRRLDCARCFFLTMAGKLSHWPSLGTMANHLSASSSVVNSR